MSRPRLSMLLMPESEAGFGRCTGFAAAGLTLDFRSGRLSPSDLLAFRTAGEVSVLRGGGPEGAEVLATNFVREMGLEPPSLPVC